eukprot:5453213-Amphidinium_carterae.1
MKGHFWTMRTLKVLLRPTWPYVPESKSGNALEHKGGTPPGQVAIVPRAEWDRYIQAVRKVTVILAYIISTQPEERTVVYPDWRFSRSRPAASTTSPVPRRIVGGQHEETVRTILLPATSGARCIRTESKGNVR